MKSYKLSLVGAATLGALLVCGNFAAAQDTNANRRAERRGPNVQQQVERMTTGLNLNADQKAKVTALLEGQAKQRREIFTDNNVPREERREKMRALMEDENKQLKVILTSEQFEKWQKMRQEMREQMRTRRQDRNQGQGQTGEAAPAPAPAPAPKAQ